MSNEPLDLTKYEGRDSPSFDARIAPKIRLKQDAPLLLAEVIRLRAEIAAQQATIERLESAIRWALGYDEGAPHFGDDMETVLPFGWRKELRKRAALAHPPGEPALTRKQWIEQCAARLIEQSDIDKGGASECASLCADLETRDHGSDVSKWTNPVERADEERADWPSDGEPA